jgi:hypothetical protein
MIHGTSPQLLLDIQNFDKHRSYLASQNKAILDFDFNYSQKIT